jgi:hypothetical protein
VASSHGDGPEVRLGHLGQQDYAGDGGSEGEQGGDAEGRDVALAEQQVPRPGSHGDDHLGHHDGDVEHPDAQPLAPALALRQLRRHGERDATQDLLHIDPGINRVNRASSSNGRIVYSARMGSRGRRRARERRP